MTSDMRTEDDFLLGIARARSAFESLGRAAGDLASGLGLHEVMAEFDVWVWTSRNEDKPHRCPGCHGIADRAWGRPCGPRTIMRCPAGCRLIWRYGSRVGRKDWETPSRSDQLSPWQGW